ncbi:ATP-dependent HslUV protease ATP-binding subunit HslU [Caldanaerobius fijiensis DSM 17918]|uniref:ATP-dependent protease ATPase subunit HslU n=1 Tax=Caldanaerobius fijiensis DSM 17918 TaxID=1121256 RepID=A0A1M4XQ39_9THEO|nr:ATP-dependent protease ATPase subunit HslU [Caldanaerobius fijiensis]SHE95352.1 ATP-dependent HslUV protease ATP-binding subunit HslU [Caldanaerobius fijiensis DSM 17918]
MKKELTPKEIVQELDKYIIGQTEAKKSVAVALRNRYRRSLLPDDLKEEVTPHNIIMIGPTGVGKTEIARRLAKLVGAPFVKVEATKYTEVGYVGRDVESMVRDLVEASIRLVKEEKLNEVSDKAAKLAEERLIKELVPSKKRAKPQTNPMEFLFSFGAQQSENEEFVDEEIQLKRRQVMEKLRNGELEDELIEIEVEDTSMPSIEFMTNLGPEEMNINFQDLFSGILNRKKKIRKVMVKEARRIFQQEEAQKLIDMDEVISEAIRRAEQEGIIFIDEIDKIAGREYSTGPDVSREGVQRDILPIVEGSTVMTKYGPVKTDYILFIAAGAFNVSKVSDLIPELQGRFPVRVYLNNLTVEDFKRILTEPENALVKQYKALMATEGIDVNITDEAIEALAKIAYEMNEQYENIGARRLYSIMEKLFEDISFNAPDVDKVITIDKDFVEKQLDQIMPRSDINDFIL